MSRCLRRGNQQCPWHCGCHNSFETFECFLVLPFSDSILKLSSVPALSAERIRGRALPPDPRGPSERSLVKPRRSPSSGLLRSEVVGFPPSALSSVSPPKVSKHLEAVRVLWVQNDAIAEADRRVLGHETRGRGRGAFNHERRHNHQSGTTEEARISRRVVAEKTDRDSTASSTAAVHRQLQTVG